MGVRHWVTLTSAADADTLATSLAAENSITSATKSIIGGKVEAIEIDSGDTAIGNVTFTASTDLWNLASHGLANGDAVEFSAIGTGPTGEFAVSTRYWVVGVSGADFQLAASKGGGAILSASNSSGTWTLQRSGYQGAIDDAITAVGGVELASGYSSVTI